MLLLPTLKTLMIREMGNGTFAPESTLVSFVQARAATGIPLLRLLIHPRTWKDFFSIESSFRGLQVELGWYKNKAGTAGFNNRWEPEWGLIPMSEIEDFDPNVVPKGRSRSFEELM
ncbi:hypothetical protein CALCODRAFT_101353 [Calocera cornea HHB12733]|uniref:Uncharacterized protein n=1 Tax=Calocera cornea HHB12733 TaxID=1353952 RepID=A0A165D5M5_9BASI|nr:hypothetical protein CALCODRAFT_101353 [Calocera cornea HHB12733]